MEQRQNHMSRLIEELESHLTALDEYVSTKSDWCRSINKVVGEMLLERLESGQDISEERYKQIMEWVENEV